MDTLWLPTDVLIASSQRCLFFCFYFLKMYHLAGNRNVKTQGTFLVKNKQKQKTKQQQQTNKTKNRQNRNHEKIDTENHTEKISLQIKDNHIEIISFASVIQRCKSLIIPLKIFSVTPLFSQFSALLWFFSVIVRVISL